MFEYDWPVAPIAPIYSPSSTSTYSVCPRKWLLHRTGWVPRLVQYPELCAWAGQAFAVSIEVWNHTVMTGSVPAIEVCVDQGKLALQQSYERAIQHGRRLSEASMTTLETLPALLHKAVSLYERVNPLAGWLPVLIEEPFTQWGNARPDLIARHNESQQLAVFDYKLKIKLRTEYESKELNKFDRSTQRYFYHAMTGINTFYIVMVVLSPKAYIRVEPYTVNAAYAETFLRDCQQKWRRMNDDATRLQYVPSARLIQIEGSVIHHDEYGPCEFEEACLQHQCDEQLMTLNYVQIPPEEK